METRRRQHEGEHQLRRRWWDSQRSFLLIRHRSVWSLSQSDGRRTASRPARRTPQPRHVGRPARRRWRRVTGGPEGRDL